MAHWLKTGVRLAALAMLALPLRSALGADAAHPTVVELFQSQGCSSCPPAEANVGAIADRPDVLALAFEVDYWDRLGWKDTFSKAAWTARQYAYPRAMGRESAYTPQVVVNGRVEGGGLEPGELAGPMSRGDRGAGGPSIGFSGGAVTVGAGAARALRGRLCPARAGLAIASSVAPRRRALRCRGCHDWPTESKGRAKPTSCRRQTTTTKPPPPSRIQIEPNPGLIQQSPAKIKQRISLDFLR